MKATLAGASAGTWGMSPCIPKISWPRPRGSGRASCCGRRSGPGVDVAGGLAGMAGVALRGDQLTEAALMLGAVDGMLESRHMMIPLADELVRRADLAAVRSRLDDSAFDAAFREGQSVKFEDLEAMAKAVSLRGSDRDR